MRDFLRKNPLRESARSSLGCRPPRGDPQCPQEGKDVSQNAKTTASARMRAFRGSVKKKIAELEANVTSADTSQNRKSSVQGKAHILVESSVGQFTVQEIPNNGTQEAPLIKDIKMEEGDGKDISKTDQKEIEAGTESEAESVYESRRLIMRRVIRNQAQEAKPATPIDSDHSEVDSWTELEENFAKVYEPIPYSMRMEVWQRMTKEEMLDNITSERMRAELQQKSRREILDEISHLRDHPVHFLQKKNTKGNAGNSIENYKLSSDDSPQKHMIVAEVHSPDIKGFQTDTDSEFGETDYVTRSELYRNIQNLQDSLARHHKQVIEEDSQSWRSLPSQADDPVYISRSEILSKVDRSNSSHIESHKPREIDMQTKAKDDIYVSRSEILSRLKEINESEDERGPSPANTIDSSWDLCSCVSCEQCGAGNSASEGECQCRSKQAIDKKLKEQDVHHRLPSPGDCSLLSLDSWSNGEFEKIYEPISGPKSVMRHRDFLVNRTLEEQEKRLRKLKFVDESCSSGGRYLPVDQWSLSESEDVYESLARVARASIRRSNTFSNKKSRKLQGEVDLQQRVRELLNGQKDINTTTRNKVVKVITDHIEHHLDLDNFEDEEERNQEIRERLKEALAQDWETLSNINLGHIYVPMEDSSKNSKLSSKENADYDTFGSIDSLIFEPKIPVAAEAPSDCVMTNEMDISASTDCLLDNALGQSANGSDPVLSALNLLNYDVRDKETHGESEQIYEETEEETPVPTPTPSTPRAESEQDLPVYDSEDEHHNVQVGISEIQQLYKAETSSLTQQPWPWVAAEQNARENTQEKLNSKEENQKLPLKKKFFKGLKELGFIRATSKENLKTSTVYDNTELGKEKNDTHLNASVTAISSTLQMGELESKQKDMSGYESFKVNFQRLSGKRLPSEEDSTYDYHPDHNEHLYHGDGTTTTSHDTADSETESITSLESVIFKGNIVEETDADMEEKKRKRNPFKHKFVVNHGIESDTSELIENKSLSFSAQPYLDSDTSWDYMEAMDEEKMAMQHYSPEEQSERNSVTPGPRVFGNLRRKHVYQSVENIERSVPSQSPEGENSKLQSLDSECVPTVEGIGDRSPSPSSAAICQGLNIPHLDSLPSTDEESDGRRLFRAYQRRQFRTPSDPSRRDGGGSTSTASHEYEETGGAMYQICGGSISGSSQGHGTPPVVLLKHHVYQSIESLASRSGFSTSVSMKTPPTSDALEELQFYGSRHGEPIYGARNSRLFHSMNGAFVARDNTDGSRDPPVVIRKGKAVELTEEMFKGTLEKMPHSPVNEKAEADLSFHSTLVPSALQGDDCLYFQNTVSSTESREIHTYENDSEIYGTRKEMREELLQVSRDIAGDVKDEAVPPHDAVVHPANKRQEAAGVTMYESSEKIKKVQKLGVSILGNNNDLMIRELKLKLRHRFNPEEGDDEEEEVDRKSPTLIIKSPLKATISVDTTSSVAFKREQLAPHMNKIFGSLHEKRRHTVENGDCRNDIIKKEACKIIADSTESRKESKEEKQEKNEMEKCKEREVIRVGGTDGVIEQVYVPTPDYTPVSTLPRDHREDNYLSGFTDEEDFSFDLADLAKFVHEHITKNKTLYSDPGNDLLPDGSRIENPTALDDEGGSGNPKRCVRFDMSKNLADLTATWSDLESVIFADESSALMETTENGKQENASLLSAGKLPLSRMESYKDDWLLWEQLAKMRRSKVPEDRERWEVEKTKRMLLWIHLSNNNYTQWCYKSQWWKAKQRASVAWIVQKAHKNKVPSDLQDPYYRDYEGAEHLKPGIVHRLANADLYCSALANIYGDPNFHNLSHWNIIQALARKGVYVAEPTDVALTETVLIQVSPIKMSAHLAVIEAMMALYIREVVVAERAVSVLQRVSGGEQPERTPQDQEEALVLWINHIAQALQERVHQQVQSQDQELPVFPRIQDLSDLSDGIGLAALIAFYCPQELPWGEIAVADPPSIADSLYNIGLVIRFCQESLPYNPCLLTKEDIVYMHSSVKQNVLAFVAELFFLLELEPVSCVSLPGTRKTSSKFIQLSSPAMKPAGAPSVRRSHSMNLNDMADMRSRMELRSERSEHAPSSYNSDYGGRDSSMSDGQEGDFVVQRSRGLATLSDMMRTQQSPRASQDFEPHYSSRGAAKERYNMDSKEEELGERSRGLVRRGSFTNSQPDLPAAGMPSRYEERPHGRSRSRRNSVSAEDSQLTIENFGGSQDNLNYISRNPDKEPFVHTGRRENTTWEGSQARESREGSARPESRGSRERSVERRREFERSSIDELDNRLIDKLEREALEREKRDSSQYTSKEKLIARDPRKNAVEALDSGSESDLSFDREKMSKATSFAELSKLKEQLPGGINIIYMQSDKEDTTKRSNKGPEKKTTFAALPNQTTWKQQSAQSHADDNKSVGDENMEPQIMASELHNVRLKLEEKRRRIESEKRKMEQAMNKQRQKLGKEAFMQAVVKGDIGSDVNNLSRRWLEGEGQADELRTPDIDNMDYDEYHKSLTQMTDSLTEIQGDIQRLANQQQQIQSMMHNGMTPQTNQGMQQPPPHGQFYLHDQQGSPVRRMWGQQSSSDGYSSMSPATRRAQWGPVRPMMPQGDYMMSGQHPGYYQGYQMSHPAQMPPLSQVNTQQQMGGTGPGFMLHGQTQSHSLPPQSMYQNGQGYYSPEHQYRGYPPSAQTYASGDQRQMGQTPPFRLHGEGIGGEMRGPGSDGRCPGSLRSSAQSSPSRQPLQRQQKSPSPTRQTSVSHAPVAAPPPDDMEPQNVSFIESEDHPQEDPSERFKRLSITSGSKTYRISHEPGSPTRPSLGVKTFRVPTKKGTPVYDDVDLPQPTPPQRSITPPYQDTYRHGEEEEEIYSIKTEPLDGPKPEKGFYISFDSDSAPRKPKPQLRTKKMSRKNSSPSTPASTPSREELPVVPDRPSRTSNGSFGSMSQSPSMAPQSPSPSSYPATSTIGSLSPQTNGLFHNSPLGTEQESLHESHTQLPLEDMNTYGSKKQLKESTAGMALVIGDDITNNESSSVSEMEKKKERLMMLSMKRKQEQEEARRKKEMEAQERKEAEKLKEEEKQRKKEEEKARREVILERYKIKKAMEEAEKEGRYYEPPPGFNFEPPSSASGKQSVRMRNKPAGSKPRPKTMAHAPSASDSADGVLSPSQGKRGSTHNIAGEVGRRGESSGHGSMRKSSGRWGSSHSLSRAAGSRGSSNSLAGDYPSTTRTLERGHTGRRPTSVIGYSSIARGGESRKDSLYGSQGNGLNYHEGYHVHEARRPSLALEGSRMRRGSASSSYGGPSSGYRKYRSTGNLSGQSEHDSLVYHMSEDSGLGRATPPRRAPSPGMARHLPSPSGPGSLPPGLFSKRKQAGFDDAASDISSTASSTADYLGPRLFKQPTAKSNRTIILNAVEYCVFPGAVNQTAKHRVLEEIARSESKHFLVLFRDAGCQFRAIYSFNPETEEVYKLYGTGPKQVTDRMFDKFFKYNSGGKCFSQIHTKHLTVTIDAFTIHNSLWQGKRVNLPSKKDMTLVI